MEDRDKKKFAEIMGTVGAAMGKEMDPKTLRAYWTALCSLNIESFETAMVEVVKKEERFPPPARILEYSRVGQRPIPPKLPMQRTEISEMGRRCLDYVRLSLEGKITKEERLQYYATLAEAYPEHRSDFLNNAKWVERNM